jgi:hypothetical protein
MRRVGRFQGLSSLRIISSNSLWPGFVFDVLKRKKKLRATYQTCGSGYKYEITS